MQNSLTTARITPIADSTTALKITKANGTTNVVTVDTTNSYVGVNCAPVSNLTVRNGSTCLLVANSDYAAGSAGSSLRIRLGATSGDTYGDIQAIKTGGTAVTDLCLNPSGGNVGIGTASPKTKLHLGDCSGTADDVGELTLAKKYGTGRRKYKIGIDSNFSLSIGDYGHNSDDTYAPYLTMTYDGKFGIGTIAPSHTLTVGDAAKASATFVEAKAAADQMSGFSIFSGTTQSWAIYRNVNSSDLHFYDTAIRVTIANGGHVGIGCTPSYQLELSTNSAGKPTSEHWTVTSDARLKQDISDISNALTTLLSLRGRSYQWIPSERSAQGEGTRIGFIAQEVETVFPQWVGENNKGTKHLTIAGLDALVVEAIRELKNRVEILEAKE